MASKALVFEIFGRDTSATKTLKGIGVATTGLRKQFTELAGAVGLAFGVEKVAEFGKESVAVAENMQKAQANLKTAVKNSGAQWSKYAGQVGQADDKGRALGFTNGDTEKALATLTTSLKSPSKALQYLGVVQDLAASKGMDLSSAALLVAKAAEGQIRPLKALGIDLNVTAGGAAQVAKAQKGVADAQAKVNEVLKKYPHAASAASGAHDQYLAATKRLSDAQETLNQKQSTGDLILDTLSKRLSGQAANAADTEAGKMDVLNAKFDAVKEKVGNSLLKSLSKIADWATSPAGGKTIDSIANGITNIADAIAATPNPIATFVAGIGLVAGAFWGLDAAMDANPIGLIVLGIEAVIALVAALATNFGGITKTITDFGFGFYSTANHIAQGIAGLFQGMANGAIDALNTLLIPLNDLLVAVGQKPIHLGHVDLTSALRATGTALSGAQAYGDASIFAPGGGYVSGSGGGSGKGGGSVANGPRAFATGAIIRATPGGVNINGKFAEAGHDEAIIPLTQQNMQAIGGNNVFHITTDDPIAAANATVRRLNLARA